MEQTSCGSGKCLSWERRPAIRSGFHGNIFRIFWALSGDQGGQRDPEKASGRESCWYPVADAKELEDVDYNLREQRVKNMIVPDGSC